MGSMFLGGHGRLSKDPNNEGVIRKVADEAEILFYQTLNGDDPQLHAIPDYIRSFFPKYYGVFDKSTSSQLNDEIGCSNLWSAFALVSLFESKYHEY